MKKYAHSRQSHRIARARLPYVALAGLLAAASDVSTAGTLVVAQNLGTFGNPGATVNGVPFTPFVTSTTSNTLGSGTPSASSPILGNNVDFGEIVPPFTNLATGYQLLLQSGSFTSSAVFPPPTISMTLNGLTTGAEYHFQWWAHQSEPISFAPPPPGIPTTTATSGGIVTQNHRGGFPGSLGQFAIGVFTATSGSQVIEFNGSDTKTRLSAFQLRQTSAPPIPEPTPLSLISPWPEYPSASRPDANVKPVL